MQEKTTHINNDSHENGDTASTGARILIIDDDEVYLHLCTRYLQSDTDANHVIVSASSIQEAFLASEGDTFDCVIVDYGLPDGNGAEAIQQLTEALGDDMPCVIVLTGLTGEQVAIDAVRSGAMDFLMKSHLTKPALCRAVSNAVEKSRLQKLNLRRVKDLEIANGLLLKRNEEIQRFYHTVSHEVKTPLTAIQEFVSLVHDGLAGDVVEQQRIMLGYALQSCDQIKSHFNELLELARFETGKMQVELAPCSLREVFEYCMLSARPEANDRRIGFVVNEEPGLPLVMMQSNRIIQVVSNLIGNALKYTPEEGTIVLSAAVSDDKEHICVSVKDSGCGISADDVQHIFERLYQGAGVRAHVNNAGLGLGLSIAAQIVELHGSCIRVHSVPDEGSEFSFDLRISESQQGFADQRLAS